MKKEEILEKSRQENKGADLVVAESNRKAQGIAGAVSIFLGATLNLAASAYTDYRFPELWAMFFTYAGTQGAVNALSAVRHGKKDAALLWGGYALFMLFCAGMNVVQFFQALKAGRFT